MFRDGVIAYAAPMTSGTIRVGIGGWTYEPWRDSFYPPKWPQKRELEYAASKLTAIEINGTYYSSFKPASFAGWAKAVPDGFVFALKASRYATNRKVLAEAGESVMRFIGQGIVELGDRLGPVLWQFMATKRFDPDDFGAFLALLPKQHDGVALRHAVQVRHESFQTPDFVAMARAANVAVVFDDSEGAPTFPDATSDFVYARLENAVEDEPAGYAPAALDGWGAAAVGWAKGGVPAGMTCIGSEAAPIVPRDVFLFFINGAKVRAPHGAMALIDRLGGR